MTKVDKDGSGAIDNDEFMALMAEQIENRDQEEELRKVFRIYDDDDNGLISGENLKRCADDLGEDVNDEEIDEMIAMAHAERQKRKDRGEIAEASTKAMNGSQFSLFGGSADAFEMLRLR